MKKYSLFHIPLLSYYSSALCRDVAFNWKGIGFGYLFLLLVLCWLVLVINVDNQVKKFFDEETPDLISQFPTITVEKGQASIEELQPYYITYPETGETIAIIDTTGSINSLDSAHAPILLTRTQLMFKKSEVETRTFDLSKIDHYVLDKETLNGWIAMIKSYLALVIYPFLLIGSFVYRIIQMLIYAAIGLLFASICKTQLEYNQLLRLSVVAVTPCIIIGTVVWSFGISLPMEGLIYFLFTMAYLFFGIKSVGETDKEENETS